MGRLLEKIIVLGCRYVDRYVLRNAATHAARCNRGGVLSHYGKFKNTQEVVGKFTCVADIQKLET